MGNNNITPSEDDKIVVRRSVEYLNINGIGTENIFGTSRYDDDHLGRVRSQIITGKF